MDTFHPFWTLFQKHSFQPFCALKYIYTVFEIWGIVLVSIHMELLKISHFLTFLKYINYETCMRCYVCSASSVQDQNETYNSSVYTLSSVTCKRRTMSLRNMV